MRATLNIPDTLMKEVQNATGEKSKTQAIVTAMEEYVRRKKLTKLLALKGRIQIEDVTEALEQLEVKEMENHDRGRRHH